MICSKSIKNVFSQTRTFYWMDFNFELWLLLDTKFIKVQTLLNANIKTDLKIFSEIFPKFDIKYCNFYKKKKRKWVLKIKINKRTVKRLKKNKNKSRV